VILVGGIDLSVGSLLALCTVTGALAYGWGSSGGALVIPVMLLTILAAGLLNCPSSPGWRPAPAAGWARAAELSR
jgi:ribose/xylose/arabinose/galactoside ABC-type transport system permease subunit